MITRFSWQAWKRPAPSPKTWQTLVFPLPYTPSRIGVIGAGYFRGKNMRVFDAGEVDRLNAWGPEALIAPLEQCLALADRKLAEPSAGPSLSVAIVLLTRVGEAALEDEHRDRIWRAFGVPVFEQLLAEDGRVIARECEVHDGLHLIPEAAGLEVGDDGELMAAFVAPGKPAERSRTGLKGEITKAECECGSSTPRLRNLTAVARGERRDGRS